MQLDTNKKVLNILMLLKNLIENNSKCVPLMSFYNENDKNNSNSINDRNIAITTDSCYYDNTFQVLDNSQNDKKEEGQKIKFHCTIAHSHHKVLIVISCA